MNKYDEYDEYDESDECDEYDESDECDEYDDDDHDHDDDNDEDDDGTIITMGYIIYTYMWYPLKIYHCLPSANLKEVIFVGNLLQEQNKYTQLLSKRISTYSGQKTQDFLKETTCCKLQFSFP